VICSLGIKAKFHKYDSNGDGYVNLFEMQSQTTDTREILKMSDVMERYDKTSKFFRDEYLGSKD
jgi:hypothetical protein